MICPVCCKDLTNPVRLLGNDAYLFHMNLHSHRVLTDALEKIIGIHGTREHPRHEAAKMATIASSALEEVATYYQS